MATAEISIQITSAGFILGATVGSGTLIFDGKQYPLSVSGISVGAEIGFSQANLAGTVANINAPSDVDGFYAAADGGLAVVSGEKAAQLSNGKVELSLIGREAGLMFSLNLSGMNISLA